MKFHNYLMALAMSAVLAACGGGGGSAGTPGFGAGTGGGGTGTGTGGGTVTPASYVMQLQLQNSAGADIASNSFAASDTVKLLATLKTAAGAPAANEVVTFAEAGGSLLQFTPTAATALTNASGQAMIEVKAKTLDSLGATTVSATATLGGTAFAASRNVAVTGAVVEGVDPQTLAKAVNFEFAVPADRSIVIAGAGGNTRSETAILQFKVVDGTGAPVPGVRVAFQAFKGGVATEDVKLNSPTGVTDASGIVAASVSSKTVPTSVVVQATVMDTGLATQSDTLTVTTGIAVQQRFSLAASKYVLNYRLNLDASTITVAVGDVNGNPVADGFAVVATTTHGLIGTSSRGGCTTVNGVCTLDYRLQTVNLADGVPIRITVSGQSSVESVSGTILLNASDVSWVNLYPADQLAKVTLIQLDPAKPDPYSLNGSAVRFDSSCKLVWNGFLGTPNGFAAPEGATLTVQSLNSQLSAAVSSGSPVLYSVGRRTPVALTFSLNNASTPGEASLQFTVTAGGIESQFATTVSYPACTPAT